MDYLFSNSVSAVGTTIYVVDYLFITTLRASPITWVFNHEHYEFVKKQMQLFLDKLMLPLKVVNKNFLLFLKGKFTNKQNWHPFQVTTEAFVPALVLPKIFQLDSEN